MKKYQCDICKCETDEFELSTLREFVSPDPGVKEVCKSCLKEIEDAHWRIKKVLDEVRISWIRKIVNKFIKKKSPIEDRQCTKKTKSRSLI